MNSHTILLLLRPDAAQGLLHLKKAPIKARGERGLVIANEQPATCSGAFAGQPAELGRCLRPAALSFVQ